MKPLCDSMETFYDAFDIWSVPRCQIHVWMNLCRLGSHSPPANARRGCSPPNGNLQSHLQAVLFPAYSLGRCEIFIFPHQKYAPLGIWALIHVLTGEEKNILRSDFVWTSHKLTENLVKTSLKYKGNGHYLGDKFVLAITFYQLRIFFQPFSLLICFVAEF